MIFLVHSVLFWKVIILLTYGSACTDWGYAVNDLSCLDTWNPESLMYKDLRVRNNMSRQWQWIICNELGFFQT